jgi:hypothetical protein
LRLSTENKKMGEDFFPINAGPNDYEAVSRALSFPPKTGKSLLSFALRRRRRASDYDFLQFRTI